MKNKLLIKNQWHNYVHSFIIIIIALLRKRKITSGRWPQHLETDFSNGSSLSSSECDAFKFCFLHTVVYQPFQLES